MKINRSEILRSYLKKHRGEQARLARELGIDTSNISQWFSQGRAIPEDKVEIIERFLGISLDDPISLGRINRTVERDQREQLLASVAHRLNDTQLGKLLGQALEFETSNQLTDAETL